jgi:biopolymer transport protein ExbD
MTAIIAGRTAVRRFDIRQNHDMNVTPFIDVMLVLLIVFIIAAPLATTAINVDIAAGNGPGAVRTPGSIPIDDRGALSIRSSAGTVQTSLERLGRDLASATRTDAARGWVVVDGAPHTRYGAFMAVMDPAARRRLRRRDACRQDVLTLKPPRRPGSRRGAAPHRGCGR